MANCEPMAIADTEYNRTSMFHPRVLFCTLIPTTVLVVLLGGCIMPSRQDATPVPAPTEPPMAEPAPAPTPEGLTAVVNQNANVRTGPSTDYAVAFWLTAGAEGTVVGRNADGTWLQIEHEDRTGWIFTALTDIAAEGMAELRAAPPLEWAAAESAPEPTPEPEPIVEPTPETVAPTPEPEPAVPDSVVTTVTGTVVNLRKGPGTDHPTDGQTRAGDQVHVTGRNADGRWLQILHPTADREYAWIYSELTDIDAYTLQRLVQIEEIPIPAPLTPVFAPDSTPAPDPPTFAFDSTPPWPTPVAATDELTVRFGGSAFNGKYHLLPHWSKRPINEATGQPFRPKMSFDLLIEPGNVRVSNVDGGETIIWPRVRSIDVVAVLEEGVDCADVSAEDWSIIKDVSIVGRECAALPTVGEHLFLTYIHPYPLESDPGYNNYDPCTKPEPINYSGSDYGLDLVGLLHAAPVGINSLGVGGLGMWRIVVSVSTADMPPGICDPPTAAHYYNTREVEFAPFYVVVVPRTDDG
ncbi:MAG: SH3 domain-containing protein [Caldilineaceae bacterium]|nr:SH3 domain-containing protein [Caldilineaceae bacterium]